MTIDTIITLDNNNDYLLLDEKILDDKKYFYAVGVDKNDDPTNEYVIVEEVNRDGKTFIKKVTDDDMLQLLITLFTVNYTNSVEEKNE